MNQPTIWLSTSYDFVRKHLCGLVFAFLLLLIPFNIVYHFDSSRAYVDGRFVNYLDLVIHLVDLAVVALTGCLVIRSRLWKNRKFQILSGLVIGLGLFQVLVFIDVIVTYSVIRFVFYLLCVCAVVLSCTDWPKVPISKAIWRLLFVVLSFSVLLQSVIGLVQFAIGHVLGLSWLGESIVHIGSATGSSVYLSDGYHLRAYGTFPHPNVLGGYLVVSLLLLFSLFDSANKTGISKRDTLFTIPVMLMIIAGIGVTWSRIAWVLAFFVMFCWVLRYVYQNYRDRFMIFLCQVVILILCFSGWVMLGSGPLIDSVRGRLIDQSASSDVSVVERTKLGQRAYELFRKHPWTGVGLGRSIIESSDNPVYTDRGIRIMQPVHNVLLIALSEIGIIGVGLLLVVCIVLLRCVKPTFYFWMSLLVIVGIGFFDHYLWTLPQGLVLFVVLSFATINSSKPLQV